MGGGAECGASVAGSGSDDTEALSCRPVGGSLSPESEAKTQPLSDGTSSQKQTKHRAIRHKPAVGGLFLGHRFEE